MPQWARLRELLILADGKASHSVIMFSTPIARSNRHTLPMAPLCSQLNILCHNTAFPHNKKKASYSCVPSEFVHMLRRGRW